MSFLSLFAVLLFSFGALSFGALAISWLQARSELTPSSRIYLLTIFYATIWFLVNLILVFHQPDDHTVFAGCVRLLFWTMTLLWPPVMMHNYYAACVANLRSSQPWRFILILTYCVAVVLVTFLVGTALKVSGLSWQPWFNSLRVGGLVGLFVTAGIYSALLVYVTPKPSDPYKIHDPILLRTYRNRAWVLSVLLIIVMVVVLLPSVHMSHLEKVLNLISRSFPLIFLVVNTYYLERFTFFDVFIKRGTFSLLVLGLLTIYFYFATRGIITSTIEGLTPWFLALTLLPIALSLPWVYRRLEAWLDRAWLGRRFSPEDAVKYFLSGIQSSTTEQQLARHAEERLSNIFQAPTSIVLEEQSPGIESVLDVPIKRDGEATGRIHMGRRPGRTPYFSRDVDLLTSLADVFSNMLDNVRLQKRKQEQEKREQELEIHASRSELKALRAQINPHFLFNALNAIAGLIHRDPDRAEETVEQLSEVFRYTLKGSEKEWARLEDEIDFVRSYLDVEQARFGNRLQSSIDVEDSIRNLEIPTMVIQTLVENAIKHGVARARRTGRVSVRARRSRDRVLIEVEDNGPGFPDESEDAQNDKRSAGHGLKSIRERLYGYFGNESRLKIQRDDAQGVTIIAVELPSHGAT